MDTLYIALTIVAATDACKWFVRDVIEIQPAPVLKVALVLVVTGIASAWLGLTAIDALTAYGLAYALHQTLRLVSALGDWLRVRVLESSSRVR